MKKVKQIVAVVLFLILGPGAVFVHLYRGDSLVAFLWSLPVVAIILAFLFPGVGPGHFALTHEFGPKREENESERQYHLKMAKWWALGALSLPLSLFLIFLYEKYMGFVVTMVFLGFLFGIPCILKCIGSLYKAFQGNA